MLMMVPELSLYIKVRIYTNLQAIENVQANVKCITDFFFFSSGSAWYTLKSPTSVSPTKSC